jgi:iron complex transport system permease protein
LATAVILLIICVLIIFQLIFGSVMIPFSEVVDILMGKGEEGPNQIIVLESRLPRSFSSLLGGIALALSGWMMQTLFRNPLAGPSILGITSGASLGVAVVVLSGSLFGFSLSSTFGSLSIVGGAIIGSTSILLIMLLAAGRMKDQITLLIIGIMVGHFTGAIESILQYKTSDSSLRSFIIWGMGSFADANYTEIIIITLVTAASIIPIYLKKQALNIMLLGDDYAQSMGIQVKKLRLVLIIVSGLLAGVVTAFCGPIAFIGLVVPHIARMLLRTADHRKLFIPILLIGAMIGLSCDFISRIAEIPLNAITSALGAPVVIWILLRNSKSKAII